jgi:hypothetical protein
MKTERQRQAAIRRKDNLPYRCECGGVMEYAVDFGRVFSVCKKCTPVVNLNTRGCKPMKPETAAALGKMFKAMHEQLSRLPQ